MWPSDCTAHPDPSNPWNIPDWRDAKKYPTIHGTSQHIWRWQFLRRSHAYRSLWGSFCANRDAWLEKCEGKASRHDDAAGKYNLAYLINPACDYIHEELGIFLEQISGLVLPAFYIRADVENFVREASARGLYLARLDPDAPIEPQLQLIQDELKKWKDDFAEDTPRTQRKRKRADSYQVYLRLLDARERRVKWSVIESVFKKEKASRSMDSLRASFKAAEKHRDRYGSGEK